MTALRELYQQIILDHNKSPRNYGRMDKPDRKIETRPDLPHRDVAAMSAFIESVRTRKKPAAGAEQGRESLLACLLVREAVYRRQPVTMKQITG